jgi:hypothetical protein
MPEMPHRLADPTPLVGIGSMVFALTLGEWHTLVGIAVGLASLAYVITKTVLLIRNRDKTP